MELIKPKINWDKIEYTDLILLALKDKKFNTLLEIGCGKMAQNLRAIRKAYPKVKLWGYDMNSDDLECAKEITSGIELEVGDCTKKKTPFGNRKFDIVFMMATFLLIAVSDTEQVMKNILKIAKKWVILIEMHSSKVPMRGRPISDTARYIERNYGKLLKNYGFKEIRRIKIPRSIWPGANYSKDTFIIMAER